MITVDDPLTAASQEKEELSSGLVTQENSKMCLMLTTLAKGNTEKTLNIQFKVGIQLQVSHYTSLSWEILVCGCKLCTHLSAELAYKRCTKWHFPWGPIMTISGFEEMKTSLRIPTITRVCLGPHLPFVHNSLCCAGSVKVWTCLVFQYVIANHFNSPLWVNSTQLFDLLV